MFSVLSHKFVNEILSGLVSGHDFSRAVHGAKTDGLQPLSAPVRVTSMH